MVCSVPRGMLSGATHRIVHLILHELFSLQAPLLIWTPGSSDRTQRKVG